MKSFLVTVITGTFLMVSISMCAQKPTGVSNEILQAETDMVTCPSTALSLMNKKTTGRVKRVVDGDTLVLTNGTKVRLVGVDTPESKHPRKPVQKFAEEASEFTRKNIEGKEVELVFDQNSAATKHRDRYRRQLAYVYRAEDGFDLNAELVKQGYAHVYTEIPSERMEEFRCYLRSARNARRGLWGSE